MTLSIMYHQNSADADTSIGMDTSLICVYVCVTNPDYRHFLRTVASLATPLTTHKLVTKRALARALRMRAQIYIHIIYNII